MGKSKKSVFLEYSLEELFSKATENGMIEKITNTVQINPEENPEEILEFLEFQEEELEKMSKGKKKDPKFKMISLSKNSKGETNKFQWLRGDFVLNSNELIGKTVLERVGKVGSTDLEPENFIEVPEIPISDVMEALHQNNFKEMDTLRAQIPLLDLLMNLNMEYITGKKNAPIENADDLKCYRDFINIYLTLPNISPEFEDYQKLKNQELSPLPSCSIPLPSNATNRQELIRFLLQTFNQRYYRFISNDTFLNEELNKLFYGFNFLLISFEYHDISEEQLHELGSNIQKIFPKWTSKGAYSFSKAVISTSHFIVRFYRFFEFLTLNPEQQFEKVFEKYDANQFLPEKDLYINKFCPEKALNLVKLFTNRFHSHIKFEVENQFIDEKTRFDWSMQHHADGMELLPALSKEEKAHLISNYTLDNFDEDPFQKIKMLGQFFETGYSTGNTRRSINLNCDFIHKYNISEKSASKVDKVFPHLPYSMETLIYVCFEVFFRYIRFAAEPLLVSEDGIIQNEKAEENFDVFKIPEILTTVTKYGENGMNDKPFLMGKQMWRNLMKEEFNFPTIKFDLHIKNFFQKIGLDIYKEEALLQEFQTNFSLFELFFGNNLSRFLPIINERDRYRDDFYPLNDETLSLKIKELTKELKKKYKTQFQQKAALYGMINLFGNFQTGHSKLNDESISLLNSFNMLKNKNGDLYFETFFHSDFNSALNRKKIQIKGTKLLNNPEEAVFYEDYYFPSEASDFSVNKKGKIREERSLLSVLDRLIWLIYSRNLYDQSPEGLVLREREKKSKQDGFDKEYSLKRIENEALATLGIK